MKPEDAFELPTPTHMEQLVTDAMNQFPKTRAALAKTEMTARDSQVGGAHYKTLKIQPFEYSLANGLDACQHTAIKYITRFREKGGVKDLEKAIHTIQFLIEHERKHSNDHES